MPTVDFGHLLLSPNYDIYADPTTLTPLNGEPVTISAIDKSSGVETSGGDIAIPVLVPAAVVRASALAALGVSKASLRGGEIVMNGTTWSIESTMAKATPAGEADGEVYLFLMET